MFGQVFAHRTIRKYVIYFGMLFSEVYLTRDDADGRVQTIKVPLNFGPMIPMILDIIFIQLKLTYRYRLQAK